MNDLRNEIKKLQKAYAPVVQDNSKLRTRFQVLENSCRENAKSENAFFKKGTTKGIREKQPALPTKKAKEAFETSNLILSLETECENLRSHLKNSVPESEFLHEKKQYVAVIDNLIEENMHLRQIIGEYEQHCRESEKLLAKAGGTGGLVQELRRASVKSRKKRDFYKNALYNLIDQRKPPIERPRRSNTIGPLTSHRRIASSKSKASRSVDANTKNDTNSNDGICKSKSVKNQGDYHRHLRMYQTTSSSEQSSASKPELKTNNRTNDRKHNLNTTNSKKHEKNDDGEGTADSHRSPAGDDDSFFDDEEEEDLKEVPDPRQVDLSCPVEVDDDKNVDQAKDKDASAGTAVGDQNAPLIDEQQSKVPVEDKHYQAISKAIKSHILRQQMLDVRIEAAINYNKQFRDVFS